MESPTDKITVTMSEEIVDDLVRLARELGVSVDKLATVAIKEYLVAHA